MAGRTNRTLMLACGILLAGLINAPSARAQGFSGAGYGLGFYNYGGAGGNINQMRIPFYAMYPPVYYSFPVPRTYGYSPFAYPPGTMTPEIDPTAKGAMMDNPYIPKPAKSIEAVDRQAALTVINPFFEPAPAASVASAPAPQQ